MAVTNGWMRPNGICSPHVHGIEKPAGLCHVYFVLRHCAKVESLMGPVTICRRTLNALGG